MIGAALALGILFYAPLVAILAIFLCTVVSTLASRPSSDLFVTLACSCLLPLHVPSLFLPASAEHAQWLSIFEFARGLLLSFAVFIFIDHHLGLLATDRDAQARLDAELSRWILSRWLIAIVELGFQIASSFSPCQAHDSFFCYRFGRPDTVWVVLLLCKIYPSLLLGDALAILHVALRGEIARLGWQCSYILGTALLFPLSKALVLLDWPGPALLPCALAWELFVLALVLLFAFAVPTRRLAFPVAGHGRLEPAQPPSPLYEDLAMPHACPRARASPTDSSGPGREEALLPASEWSSYYHLPDMRRVLFFCRSWLAAYYQNWHTRVSRAVRAFIPPFGVGPDDDLSEDDISVASSLLQSYHSSTAEARSRAEEDNRDFDILSVSSF